ncbi:gap junction gamma-1 protein-like [Synchiropus picturatus]
MGWNFLTGLLEEIHSHSTFVGKIWLTVLIVFRIVLTVVGGESIYYDEQSKFVCNTGQPGCENVCYDSFAPLSHVRFWVFQTIVVTAPSLMYLVYTVNKIAQMEEHDDSGAGATLSLRKKQYVGGRSQQRCTEEAEDGNVEDPMIYEMIDMGNDGVVKGGVGEKQSEVRMRHDGRKLLQKDGLMQIYVLQLLVRVALEVGFLCGQYALYGFTVPPSYECTSLPCPHTVNCYVSRPTEKTIFLLIMYAVSFLCLAINIWEMLHLGFGSFCEEMQSHQNQSAKCHRLTNPAGSLEDPAFKCREYDGQPCSWDIPSAPPGYNFTVKPLLVSTAPGEQALLSNNFTHSKIVHQQNSVNIAQEERQQNSNNKDISAARRGVSCQVPMDSPQLQKTMRNKSQQERKQRQTSKHCSSKADTVRCCSGNNGNIKYGEVRGTEWI